MPGEKRQHRNFSKFFGLLEAVSEKLKFMNKNSDIVETKKVIKANHYSFKIDDVILTCFVKV